MQEFEQTRRGWFSLPVRISVGLVLAAIIPLFVMLIYTNYQTRPALIEQANKAMASDAQTRVELIDNYFHERLTDALTLTQVPSLQAFMALPRVPDAPAYQDAAAHAAYSLQAGVFKDKNYAIWALFDPTGALRLSYPTQPTPHGSSLVPAPYLQAVMAGKTFISAVYYAPGTQKASVDIYSPVTAPGATPTPAQPQAIVGFMRSTLNLDYIWNSIVQQDRENNGKGSYAFILDENGVRIADTDPARRFSSVEQIKADLQQQISQEARYGSTERVRLLADSAAANALHSHASAEIFQGQPAGQNEQFQIARRATANPALHWNYFVLSPVSTVTAVAYQQQLSTTLVALLASLLVALIGLLAGRALSRPILHSVENLRGSSQALSTLATTQQDAASEQMWVVDSSQVGLQSVQYYTGASKVALRQLHEVATELAEHWRQSDARRIEQALQRILAATHYLENATGYQQASNQKLATALKVATQVTEQLHMGATSATEAADQLEGVVKRLRAVVGR